MQASRCLSAALLTALLVTASAAGQEGSAQRPAGQGQGGQRQGQTPSRVSPMVAPPEAGSERLALHAYALRHRRAGDALEVVRPLLSPLGTVELQPGRNTVVVRDSLSALSRIVPELRRFDRPVEPLEIEVLVVRALAGRPRPGAAPSVPPELERRLRALLRYERYELVAEGRLQSRENEDVTFELGDGFAVRFRLGELADGRVRLSEFQVDREASTDGGRPLIHTNLNLWLERPVALGLARSESSDSALMVAITARRGAPARPPAPAAGEARP